MSETMDGKDKAECGQELGGVSLDRRSTRSPMRQLCFLASLPPLRGGVHFPAAAHALQSARPHSWTGTGSAAEEGRSRAGEPGAAGSSSQSVSALALSRAFLAAARRSLFLTAAARLATCSAMVASTWGLAALRNADILRIETAPNFLNARRKSRRESCACLGASRMTMKAWEASSHWSSSFSFSLRRARATMNRTRMPSTRRRSHTRKHTSDGR
mmetsp:Transcript_11460/g.46363  ORF Transcript_11460/g.46363 Transcript_11460/m.46363 type:complete len:215 (+) Transcript_11460:22-666(+)